MSVTAIAVYSSFSLLHGLLLAAGAGAVLAGMQKGFFEVKGRSLEESKEVLKKKMFDDIADDLQRIGGHKSDAAYGALRSELEDLRDSLGEKLDRDAAMTSTVAELHLLQQKVRETELDEAQCAEQRKAAEQKIEALNIRNVVPYAKELTRLRGELEKIRSLPASERMFELQGILDQLQEMETLSSIAADADIDAMKENRYVFEPSQAGEDAKAPSDEKNARQIEIRKIRAFAERIARLDEHEGEKLRPLLEGLKADTPFPERLDRLRRQLQTSYGQLRERVLLTQFFREKLSDLLAIVRASEESAELKGEGGKLVRRCETLCGGKYIDRAAFMALYEDIARFAYAHSEDIADSLFARKVERALDEMGYELLTDEEPETRLESLSVPALAAPALLPGQVRYLESPYEGYRVMLKMDAGGGLTVRLVRLVQDEEEKKNAGDYQRQKDLETGKKWCRDFDGFLERMKEQGMPLDVSLRKEPEETEVLVVVDTSLAQTARRKKSKKQQDETDDLKAVRL